MGAYLGTLNRPARVEPLVPAMPAGTGRDLDSSGQAVSTPGPGTTCNQELSSSKL